GHPRKGCRSRQRRLRASRRPAAARGPEGPPQTATEPRRSRKDDWSSWSSPLEAAANPRPFSEYYDRERRILPAAMQRATFYLIQPARQGGRGRKLRAHEPVAIGRVETGGAQMQRPPLEAGKGRLRRIPVGRMQRLRQEARDDR